MGEVYLAEQLKIKTKVAIKVLLPHISADKAHVERFFNEAVAVSKIAHAGIVNIFDVGFHSDGQAYLVMEYLNGETLSSRIKRERRLPLGQVSEIGRQISSILDATHKAGITHRDLKPDNVFLVPDSEVGERVKILDFGIAKLSSNSGVTATAVGAMGTPDYMSPEQWKNAKNVDWRTDAYALGCLTFEMACGRPPFLAESIGEACTKHLTELPPLVQSLVPALAGPFSILVARLLEKSPELRPASMREIANTFTAIGGDPSESLIVSTSPHIGNVAVAHTKLSFVQKKRTPWIVGGAATILIGAAAGITFVVTRHTAASATAVATPPTANSVVALAPIIVDAAVLPTPAAVVVDAAVLPTPAANLAAEGEAAGVPTAVVSTRHRAASVAPTVPGRQAATLAVETMLPAALDRDMISSGIARMTSRVIACGDQYSTKGKVKVSVKVGSDGLVTSAVVTATPDSDLGRCVEAVMKRSVFARTQNGGAFSYPFNF